MNYPNIPYRIFPLGNTAITIDFGNQVDEKINRHVLALFDQFCQDPLPGMIEAVPAYSSLTIYYDLFNVCKSYANGQTAFDFLSGLITQRLQQPLPEKHHEAKLVTIPVCYAPEFAPDIEEVSKTTHLPADKIIQIHLSRQYRVYMLGFLPGFSYMGETDERIAISRKPQPVAVVPGSVGIAGRQTGIYPLASPGGWQIIGRTPLKLFDATKDEPTLLKAGDSVQFISISKNEFENY